MTPTLKPYPKMKDSGAAVLGTVPEHWEVLPLCAVATPKSITGRQHLELLSVYLDHGVIPFSDVDEKRTNVTSHDLSKYQEVKPGDFVLNNQQAWRGSVGVSNRSGIVSPAYLVLSLKTSPIQSSFANLLFRGRAMVSQYLICSRGVGTIQRNLYWPQLKRAALPLPPCCEQSAIARFLDHMDRRIQKYIRAKEKLIALLDEYKQALIHQVVTGQIDVRTGRPYEEYKESGVEWLGRVPLNWTVIGLGRLVTLTVGFAFKSEGFTDSPDDIKLLRGVNVTPGRLRWDEVARWSAADDTEFSEYELKAGDIVLGMDRPLIQKGLRVAVVNESDLPALLLQRVARIRPKSSMLRDFTVLTLAGRGFFDYLFPIFTGVSVPHLSPDQINAFRLALPSLSEQRALTAYLKSCLRSIETVIDHAKKQMVFLREYRTRLIADVVTGKLDVRDAAAALPDVDPSESEATATAA